LICLRRIKRSKAIAFKQLGNSHNFVNEQREVMCYKRKIRGYFSKKFNPDEVGREVTQKKSEEITKLLNNIQRILDRMDEVTPYQEYEEGRY
jgi:hypothetical protein